MSTGCQIKERSMYIHDNPVKADIVEYPEEYLYSSARNYTDEERILDVTIIDFLRKTVK